MYFYGFFMRNASLHETTPLVAKTRGSGQRLGLEAHKNFFVHKNYHHRVAKKKRVVFILKENPYTLDG